MKKGLRYSRIDRVLWHDEKFLSLSEPLPCARYLWLFILSGQHNSSIPGLFVLRISTIAEQLGWTMSATKRCMDEIISTGMAETDSRTGIMWLPKALAHNLPPNPNVVLGWRSVWQELPPCALLMKAKTSMIQQIQELGEVFGKAFRVCIGLEKPPPSPNPSGRRAQSNDPPNRSPNGMVNGSPNHSAKGPPNRSPIQEQEQEQDSPPTPSGGASGVVEDQPETQTGVPRLPTIEPPPRHLDVQDVQQAILTGINSVVLVGAATRPKFGVALESRIQIELNAEMARWWSEGVRLDDFRVFGEWIVRGGEDGRGGFSWVTRVRPDLAWVIRQKLFLSSVLTARDWKEGQQPRPPAVARSAGAASQSPAVRPPPMSAEELREMQETSGFRSGRRAEPSPDDATRGKL